MKTCGKEKKMRIYISGPIKDMPGRNVEEFNRVAQLWRDCGHSVINPIELNPEGTPRDVCLRKDIFELTQCDAIVMLSRWQKSKGATFERNVAAEIGVIIIYNYDKPVDEITIRENISKFQNGSYYVGKGVSIRRGINE
jgi:hypothetical protein